MGGDTESTMLNGRLAWFPNMKTQLTDTKTWIYYTELDAIMLSQKPTLIMNLDFPVLKII